jgi:hypothetical protein
MNESKLRVEANYVAYELRDRWTKLVIGEANCLAYELGDRWTKASYQEANYIAYELRVILNREGGGERNFRVWDCAL